ncbi:MAG: hypothetical protein M1826_004150 [Phylliscum demangeonii]|nr:MAG: hypothetical protein M1826_004150 [Phylliscum demangeonii]
MAFIYFSDSRVTELGALPDQGIPGREAAGDAPAGEPALDSAEMTEKLWRSGRQAQAYLCKSANRKRLEAAEKGDEAAAARYDAELAALVGPKLAYGTTLAVADPPSASPKKAVARPGKQRSLQVMEEHTEPNGS